MRVIAYLLVPALSIFFCVLFWQHHMLMVCVSILVFTGFNLMDYYILLKSKVKLFQTRALLLSISLRFIIALFGVLCIRKWVTYNRPESMIVFCCIFIYYWLVYGLNKPKLI